MKKVFKISKKAICLVLMISLMVSNLVFVNAETNTSVDLGNFDLINYKARINTNPSYFQYKNLQDKLTSVIPATVVYNELNENNVFMTAVSALEVATFDSSTIVGDQL